MKKFNKFKAKHGLNTSQGAWIFACAPQTFAQWCATDCAGAMAQRMLELIETSDAGAALIKEAKQVCPDRRGRPKLKDKDKKGNK